MSLRDYSYKASSEGNSGSQNQQSIYRNDLSYSQQLPVPKNKKELRENGGELKKKKKKKVTKKQQNEGIRIIEQKKIKYLFQRMCNPDGEITMESLGKALVKFKIQFQIQDLKSMLLFSKTKINPQPDLSDVNNSEDEKFDEKQYKISLQEFQLFYSSITKK